MKALFRSSIIVCTVLLTIVSASFCAGAQDRSRSVLSADFGWKFTLGDPSGAEAITFSDATWRSVDLPHDWSIESAPQATNPTGAGGGFFSAGIGWYRKSFTAPAAWRGKKVSVEFDGVYRNASVFLNGQKLGTHPYGYTSFTYDLTPSLILAGPNLLAVRVDNSAQPNSRWYSGSGIYRHTRVVVTELTHIAHWGVFVSTHNVSAESATVAVETKVANEANTLSNAVVRTSLYNRTGARVGEAESSLRVAAGHQEVLTQQIQVARPSLWSNVSPTLYRAVSQVVVRGNVADRSETSFGIRSLTWSADRGLLLNGISVKLTGGSVHHDNGPLGAAAFDRAEVRKVELLKAAGHNAVRTAHNPPSPAFLDACDRLGLLVLDEPFDTWRANKVKHDYGGDFDEWSQRDISSMILRDRNHPAIVIWGIGNEIPELETERGREMGRQLADQVRSLDSTRPLTLAFPGTTTTVNAQAVFSLLNITGYNYNILPSYAEDHRQLPSRLMLTTESYPSKAFPLWAISRDNTYVLGDLTWTALDYLGESGLGAWSYGTPEQAAMAEKVGQMMAGTGFIDQLFTGLANGQDMDSILAQGASDPATKSLASVFSHSFPWHASACGDMDLTGFRKPESFYRDIVWNGGDRVYATVRLPEPEGKKIIAIGWATYPTMPSWSWPGHEGKQLTVEVYSASEKVQLFLNDKLIGEASTGVAQEFKATFNVPYAPGVLKVVGLRAGRRVAESVLSTATKASNLRLTTDRKLVDADGQDLSYVTVEAVDVNGTLQPNLEADVHFSLAGAGSLAAVGNGNGEDAMNYKGDHVKLFQGRAVAVVRTSTQAGTIILTAHTQGLPDRSVMIVANAIRMPVQILQ